MLIAGNGHNLRKIRCQTQEIESTEGDSYQIDAGNHHSTHPFVCDRDHADSFVPRRTNYGTTTNRAGLSPPACALGATCALRTTSCTSTQSTIIRIRSRLAIWQARAVGVVATLRRIMTYSSGAMDRVDRMWIEVLKHPPRSAAPTCTLATSQPRWLPTPPVPRRDIGGSTVQDSNCRSETAEDQSSRTSCSSLTWVSPPPALQHTLIGLPLAVCFRWRPLKRAEGSIRGRSAFGLRRPHQYIVLLFNSRPQPSATSHYPWMRP